MVGQHTREESSSDMSMANGDSSDTLKRPLVGGEQKKPRRLLGSFCLSLFQMCPIPTMPSCSWQSSMPSGPSEHPSLGNQVIGTLYGYRKGRVHFAVQEDPKSVPVLLAELATETGTLVKEMASGVVKIVLECDKASLSSSSSSSSSMGERKLFDEAVWSMYCNGRKSGYALTRVSLEVDLRVLSLVQAVSMGAGVLPSMKNKEDDGGELMYMRAKFERLVGSCDSEAFYMMNPDGTGSPDLSIFLIRI